MKIDVGHRPPDYLIERYEEGGHLMERVIDNSSVVLEWHLRQMHVSPAIIERVLRLNPPPVPFGQLLRGLHRKPGRWWGMPSDLIPRGEVLRRYGREIWNRIPRSEWVKNGRRVWAPMRAVYRARMEAAD